MPKINILPPEVAQLIAAGEVVDRPGSVIKEMVENSIDAGATAVTVEIRNGGNTFLRVSDNGCGIAREDCPAAFMPHATSKIAKGEDLDSIATLGFRGEALASVASVAKVEMLTKTAEEEVGTRIIIHGGDIIDIDDAGCPTGTVITVRDLFYNTPARRKFLKKDATEAANIAQIMDRMALSHPEISFTFIKESGEALYTPGDGRLMTAVSAVLGKETAQGMIPVDHTVGRARVKGCTCIPVNSRPNRNLEIFFLNGRFIRSKTFSAALEQAYKDSIMVGKFPACVLNVELPFDLADVNVHPAKLEVRFADEQMMFRTVYYAVKTSLETSAVTAQTEIAGHLKTGSANKPEVTRPAEFKDEKTDQGTLWQGGKGGFYTVDLTKKENRPADRALDIYPDEKDFIYPQTAKESTVKVASPTTYTAEREYAYIPVSTDENTVKTAAPKENDVLPDEPQTNEYILPEYRYIGEAFGTYIIAQCGDSLYFVDKHALHERMIFNEIKSSTKTFSQPLLTPLSISLTKEEYAAVIENTDALTQAGFDISDFGDGTVIVRAMPSFYEQSDIEASLIEIAGKLISDRFATSTEKADWLFRSVACRAAIKAGEKSSNEELMKLLNKIGDIHYCPHGRPVTVELTKYKLEKEFHRQ